ncbi:Rieske (2Fe-2S) protein [Streptomyces genisteinicus]|uniref:Cytochrome bc1 complex Rieske iron-sulfur subunit n=1 Tax=Streptomyces genisteinicus TaxID=2768068 RepID=A0A7H0HPX5_9ACTN|nr:Rieske (2Fe-2S) protein [Streptomyces genisteinicus]QNP62591.1 Rieske (2Fe-2S) protein [Streptomyces genisteinicus]
MDTCRRSVLAAGAAGAVGLVTGCGGDDGGPSAPAASDGASASGGASSPAGEELTGTADVPVGGGTVFKEQKVVVTQPEAGRFKAFSAICTHQQCLVTEVADGLIVCPCHGSRFRVTDGSVERGPATRPLPPEQITVSGDAVLLT